MVCKKDVSKDGKFKGVTSNDDNIVVVHGQEIEIRGKFSIISSQANLSKYGHELQFQVWTRKNGKWERYEIDMDFNTGLEMMKKFLDLHAKGELHEK